MKLSLFTIALLLMAGQAVAHIGHLREIAGHSRWIAGAAIALAGAGAVWAGQKSRSSSEAKCEGEADQSEERAGA